jgi:hypothetical protein
MKSGFVGWVQRSATHRIDTNTAMGYALLHPSYGLKFQLPMKNRGQGKKKNRTSNAQRSTSNIQ